MVEGVGTVGPVAEASAMRVSSTASVSATAGAASLGRSSVVPLSPTTVVDPLSGVVITQYLSDTGDIASQVPSVATVAYLRVGLTAAGMPPIEGKASFVMA